MPEDQTVLYVDATKLRQILLTLVTALYEPNEFNREEAKQALDELMEARES